MTPGQVQQVRRFNRLVTQRAGALETSYLKRGRPLGEARLIFKSAEWAPTVRALRGKLGLDSGYLSRLLQSLKKQDLIEIETGIGDGRLRHVTLTGKGRAERAIYDRLSDKLAISMLEALEAAERDRLATAMGEVERLIRAASVEVALEPTDSADARRCLEAYFRELDAQFENGFDAAAGMDSVHADKMAQPSGLFVVARLEGDPVGCGGLKRVDETTGEIKRIWTASSARNIGVARGCFGPSKPPRANGSNHSPPRHQ